MWLDEQNITNLPETHIAVRLINSGDQPTFQWKASPNRKQVALVMSGASSGIVPVEKVEVQSLTDKDNWIPLEEYLKTTLGPLPIDSEGARIGQA